MNFTVSTTTQNNISFGQQVSTSLLLKAGSGKIKFEEAKLLNNQLGIQYSGHISFYKRALEIAKRASNLNKILTSIFEDLKNTPKENFESQIENYTAKLGDKIDINI